MGIIIENHRVAYQKDYSVAETKDMQLQANKYMSEILHSYFMSNQSLCSRKKFNHSYFCHTIKKGCWLKCSDVF